MLSRTEQQELIHKMVVVTNRQIFIKQYGTEEEQWLPPFLEQLEALAKLQPKMLVLREKDLPEAAYRTLAEQVQQICDKEHVPFAVHFFDEVASELGVDYLHLPLWKLEEMRGKEQNSMNLNVLEKKYTGKIGTSVHSVEDALLAERLGASWLFAGNVYETTCKEGLAGRGLDYLMAVSEVVKLPVYGIGGVNFERMEEILATGAAGGCMMSGFMTLK